MLNGRKDSTTRSIPMTVITDHEREVVPERPTRPQPHAPRKASDVRQFSWALFGAIAIAALIFALMGLFLPARGSEPSPASPTGATGAPQRFDIELGDLFVKPNVITLEAGRPVVLNVTNNSPS